MGKERLIGNAKLRKPKVYVGEPLPVKVVTRADEPDGPVGVVINGAPGKSQVLQFEQPGRNKVTLGAFSPGQSEQRTVEVEVLPRPDKRDGKTLFPIIGAAQDMGVRAGVVLRLENPDDFGPDASYTWDLGDGVALPTDKPLLRTSFAGRLTPGAPYTCFEVRLHVKPHDNLVAYTGQRSITVWNPAYYDQARGQLRLGVQVEGDAVRKGDEYLGCFRISNPESEPVRFVSLQIETLYDDPEGLAVPGAPVAWEWEVGPGETVEQWVAVPVDRIPAGAFGFAAHLRGDGPGKREVFADAYFEVRANPLTLLPVTDPELVGLLDELRAGRAFVNPDRIPVDQLRERLEAGPGSLLSKLRSALKAEVGPEWLDRKLSVLTAPAALAPEPPAGGRRDPRLKCDPHDRDLVGQECTPEDEETAIHPGLACQLTDEWRWVIVPARILNARKGDVVLSPGGSGAIGGLLRQVSPPQWYAHSGIMTANYYRLAHSTASEEWLEDSAVGEAITGDRGTEGLDPEKLKYIWPGTVEQSVDQAFNGSYLDDPDGRTDDSGRIRSYRIQAFDNAARPGEGLALVEPLVVKPDPRLEAEMPQLRETLHRVADAARTIRGHYRFFAYTDAAIFFDGSYEAPARTGWWASKTRPTVCSSFIWAAAKLSGAPSLQLEGPGPIAGPSDLEPSDLAQGAEVDPSTRDGLYFYTEAERQTAGRWLHDYFYRLAYGRAGLLGDLFSDAADDLANQICNTFAFDWSGVDATGTHAKDSERWEAPGPGRAVSPDNIKDFWDAPRMEGTTLRGLYGYVEPLLYRPARLEYRRVSRWAVAERSAILAGRVLRDGRPAPGAVVRAGGREQVADGRGEFRLELPAGAYRVEANLTEGAWSLSAHQDVSLAVGEELSVTLSLEGPDPLFRELLVRGAMTLVDDEWPGSDETASYTVLMAGIRLGPYGTHAERSQHETVGGEVRVELDLRFDWQMDASVVVAGTARLYEGTSADTTDLEDTVRSSVTVPRDRTERLDITVANRGVGGGDWAAIALTIANNRQP